MRISICRDLTILTSVMLGDCCVCLILTEWISLFRAIITMLHTSYIPILVRLSMASSYIMAWKFIASMTLTLAVVQLFRQLQGRSSLLLLPISDKVIQLHGLLKQRTFLPTQSFTMWTKVRIW